MSSALINRSIANLKTELEFLHESNVISEDFFNKVSRSLPDRYQSGSAPFELSSDAPAASLNEKQAFLSPSEPPRPQRPASTTVEEYVEAIYDYKKQQPEDLELRAGDKVKVLEHTSADWWKGSLNGLEGMFPSNYVKPAVSRAPSPVPQYQPSLSPVPQYQQPQYAQQQYAQPPPPQQQGPFPGYNYNNGNMVPYQQPQQQQPQQTVVQQEQQPQHSGMGGAAKKFGSKLGNAAIFGAGATIGSDIVNSIF